MYQELKKFNIKAYDRMGVLNQSLEIIVEAYDENEAEEKFYKQCDIDYFEIDDIIKL